MQPLDVSAVLPAPSRSLVVPIYKNEHEIDALLQVVESFAADFDQDFEAVFVVDGSPDSSYVQLARAVPQAPFRTQLLAHSRNFGSFAAIRTGLEVARGDSMAVMAADLQEPPALVREFFARLDSGSVDLVVGVREGRDDGRLGGLLSRTYWRLAQKVVHDELPRGGVDVFGCNRVLRDALLQLGERRSSLIAQLYWLGYRREAIPYERRARERGTSGWTLKAKFGYLADSVFAFSDLPIRALASVGVLGIAVAVTLGVAALMGRLTGAVTVPGYTATLLVITFFGGLNLWSLGLVGTYVWRAFENTKARPLALVATHDVHDPGAEA